MARPRANSFLVEGIAALSEPCFSIVLRDRSEGVLQGHQAIGGKCDGERPPPGHTPGTARVANTESLDGDDARCVPSLTPWPQCRAPIIAIATSKGVSISLIGSSSTQNLRVHSFGQRSMTTFF